MKFDIFTLFPQIFDGVFEHSIIKRARDAGLIDIALHHIRNHARDKHKMTDDAPYGGGGGMVMKPDPIFYAVESALDYEVPASGICGRYEGVDERVAQYLATDQISIGDYVLSGGEIAAMVIVDAVTRLLPGALGSPNAAANDSHATGLLEYPHYTRPAEFKGHRVPDILLSGDHAKVSRWRREQSLKRTLAARPDLLENAPLTEEEKKAIQRLIM
ncbi:MAG: tRNA (guanosine(37)-N1)-methyltransferase TrmD [Anaerolineaceae bacterium 4572_5.2]|nr:MAG: tRNA (guanosine(37)-N1)-methyltransferase TrmD [Anaerolineaceae bacterium 4572_5.2]